MEQLLHGIRPQDLVLAGFLLGVWYADRRSSRSRESQGKRIGDAEKKIEKVLAALEASRSDAE